MAALPTGVEIRGNSVCIWFMYRGKRCREILKGWSATPANIKKAGNLRALVLSEINLGEFEYLSRFPSSKKATKTVTTTSVQTLGELSALWLTVKETELAANTLRKTKSQIETLKILINENTPISTIRHSDILKYRNELLNGETYYRKAARGNKTGRSVRTVNNYISLLCSLLRFAHHSGFIKNKPYQGIKKLQKGKIKPDPFTKEEFSLLAKIEHGQSLNMWTFAVYTGVRHGELAALAWEDIDWENGTVHISRNLNALGMFVPPKTDAGDRIITLLEPALEALKAQRKLTALQPKTEIVFHHREYGVMEHQKLHFVFMPRMRKGEQKAYYSLSSIGARFDAAIKRAGIRRRIPYHTRHTFACWLLSAGANPSFIASQMGHENAQMVYEVYGAWIEEMNGDQVLMLNEKLAL